MSTRRIWGLVILMGCNDYGFTKYEEDPGLMDTGTAPLETTPPDRFPDLVVSPEWVDLPGVCESSETYVTLSNVGEVDLLLDLVQANGGWGVPEPPPPVLGPEESVELLLRTVGGEGELFIHSNDPDEPVKTVPLMTRPDGPPTVGIVDPLPGAVIPQAEEVLVHAIVGDEETALEDLFVEWTSDVDGYVARPVPDAEGWTEGEWRSPRTPGDHVLTVTVTDACGQSAEDSVPVCQQAGFDESLLELDSWAFAGSARWDLKNDWLELTDDTPFVVGSAFTTSISVSGANVEITFLFYIGEGSGADGLSLTAIDSSRATTYLGGDGCGIGYGGDASCTSGPALPGWSIEVDTYYNGGQDPTPEDHVMFTFNGDVDDPAIWAELPEMEDTGWHTMRVVVTEPHVLVEIDGFPYIDDDLTGGVFDFPAMIGFTAGTGSLTNLHLIDSLVVTEYVCPEKK